MRSAAREGRRAFAARRVALARTLCVAILGALATACYNPMVTVYQRTALEQQLTRTAIWRSVQGLAVHKDVLDGRWRIRVLVPNDRDESWVRGCLQIRLSDLGVDVAAPDDESASTIVAAVVYAGTDIDNFYVGVPIPGSGGQALAFYQSITERGRAEIFLSFRDPAGRIIGTTQPLDRNVHYTAMYFLTIFGPLALTDTEIDTGERFSEMGRDTLSEAGSVAGDWIVPASRNGERSDEKD